MEIVQQVGFWILVVTLVIISIHPVLQRLGIMPDKWKDSISQLLSETHGFLTKKETQKKFDALEGMADGVERLVKRHTPKGDKYKSDMVCECNVAGENPCFRQIGETLEGCKALLETIRREQKEGTERTIITNEALMKVMEALLKKLGE